MNSSKNYRHNLQLLIKICPLIISWEMRNLMKMILWLFLCYVLINLRHIVFAKFTNDFLNQLFCFLHFGLSRINHLVWCYNMYDLKCFCKYTDLYFWRRMHFLTKEDHKNIVKQSQSYQDLIQEGKFCSMTWCMT